MYSDLLVGQRRLMRTSSILAHLLRASHSRRQDGAGAAKVVVQEARRLWETREGSDLVIDDISAVVVFLP